MSRTGHESANLPDFSGFSTSVVEASSLVLITPDQAVVAAVSANASAHADRLARSVGRVVSKRQKNRATHTASGVFVEYRGIEYFLTAAHSLVDRGSDETLLFGTAKAAISVREAVHSYSKNLSTVEDLLDVGIIRVTTEIREKIGPTHPIVIDRMITHQPYDVGRNFMVVGYPRSSNKRPTKSDLPTMNRSVLVSGIRDNQRSTTHSIVSGGTHLVIGWSENTANLNGQRIAARSPAGMSGGPVFDLGDYSDFGVLSGVTQPLPLLAGIFTRHIAAEGILLGTRLNFIIDVMDRESAWPKL